jgi:hypothetical protein
VSNACPINVYGQQWTWSRSSLEAVGAASVTGIDNFSRCRRYHPERDRAMPITPVEIDGATQAWDSSPRYAQFRAPAFPSPVPCRSRCRALASLARARTSDDIRPRALCTPPPKSFARTPDLCTQPILPRATNRGQHRFAPGVHFGANSDLCATAYLRALRVSALRVAAIAGWIPCDFEARSTLLASEKAAASAANESDPAASNAC